MELRLLLAAVRRGAAFLVFGLIIGSLAGAAVYEALPRHYIATATVLIDSGAILVPGQQPYTGDPERYISDQMHILTSGRVVQQVAQRVPGYTEQSVGQALSLTHVTGTNTVDVRATASSARTAQNLANTTTAVYLADRQDPSKRLIAAQQASLQTQITALTQRIVALGNSPGSQAAQATLLSDYNALLTQQAQLTAAGATKDATAVTDPALLSPASVRSIKASEAVGGGALAGLVIGFAIALIREVRHPHVMSTAHAELVLGRDAVAALPFLPRRPALSAATRDQVRRLVSVIAASPAAEPRRTVAVCSAGENDAVTLVVRAMAAVFAEQGSVVAVVDLTVDRAAPLKVQSSPVPAAAAVRQLEQPAASRGARRPTAPSPQGVQGVAHYRAPSGVGIASTDAREYAGVLPGNFDVVIVHTPPVLRGAIAAPVSRTADDTVLVVPLRSQLESDLRLSSQLLAHATNSRLHIVTQKSGFLRHRPVRPHRRHKD